MSSVKTQYICSSSRNEAKNGNRYRPHQHTEQNRTKFRSTHPRSSIITPSDTNIPTNVQAPHAIIMALKDPQRDPLHDIPDPNNTIPTRTHSNRAPIERFHTPNRRRVTAEDVQAVSGADVPYSERAVTPARKDKGAFLAPTIRGVADVGLAAGKS